MVYSDTACQIELQLHLNIAGRVPRAMFFPGNEGGAWYAPYGTYFASLDGASHS